MTKVKLQKLPTQPYKGTRDLLPDEMSVRTQLVEALLQRAEQGEVLLLTNALVLAELVWTLESFYKLPKTEVEEKVLAVLNTPGLEVVDGELVLQVVVWYVEKNVDFMDAYNATWMNRQGLQTVCTFDQKHVARFEGITVVVPSVAGAQEE